MDTETAIASAKLAISVLSPVIDKVVSYARDPANKKGGDLTAEEMEDLAVYVLPTIKTVVEQAGLVPLQHLEPWLEKLQAAVFEAEDLLDLLEYEKIENEVSSLPQLIKIRKNKTKEKFRISYENLKKSADRAKELLSLINYVSRTPMRQPEYKFPQGSTSTTVSTTSSPLFGRDEECNTIIEMLLTDESHANSNKSIKSVPIIAIKGIPGAGKTSIAQKVFNHERVKTFDLRMWVHVSPSFDARILIKEIIELATNKKCPRIDNLGLLQTLLKESISKANKFLLILDDVWCEDMVQFDKLLSPLNEFKGNGSKIVITTRMEKVANNLQVDLDRVVSLKELKMKDCWSILKHYAFFNLETTTDYSMSNIGKQIISKVKYSPLALKAVGNSMRHSRLVSVNEWDNILRQDILKETMDVFLLSFRHLPLHLQRCFAYCSLFPKGYTFNSDELIPLWIAQGFVEITDESGLTFEEIGRIYMEELRLYSFFEFEKSTVERHTSYYKMHDLFHDLAEKVSKKYYHRFEGSSKIPETCIHLSVSSKEISRNVGIPGMSKLENLRTLFIFDDSLHTNISENEKVIFPCLTKLRALYVPFGLQMNVLSNLRIDKLKHLRYLNLQHDPKLHRILLAKLYHLQYLYINGSFEILQLTRIFIEHSKRPVPYDDNFVKGLENLVNLRTLKLCHEKSELDYWDCYQWLDIRKLTSLQNLSAFHPKNDGVNRMMPLKNLNLHGSLSIKSLENIKSEAEAAEAMLDNKINLNDLSFEWSMMHESNSCEEVLDGLEPHPNLEGLSFICYKGIKAPNWMQNKNKLPSLLKLRLYMCQRLKEIPYLPPCLQELHVENCNDLVQLPPIGDTLCTLKLEECSKLTPPRMYNKSIHLTHIVIKRCARNKETQLFNDLPFLSNLRDLRLEEFFNVQTFPNLSATLNTLQIDDFPKLTSLGNIQSLERLIIGKCPMLRTVNNSQSLKHLTILEGDITLLLPRSIERLEVDGSHRPSRPLLEECLLHNHPHKFLWHKRFERLEVDGSHRPFPPLLEENFHHISSLKRLWLEGFTTLPSLEKLSLLEKLFIIDCPDVELLPNLPSSLTTLHVVNCPKVQLLPPLPVSLRWICVSECPNLEAKYKEGGSLRHRISHIPFLQSWIHETSMIWESFFRFVFPIGFYRYFVNRIHAIAEYCEHPCQGTTAAGGLEVM